MKRSKLMYALPFFLLGLAACGGEKESEAESTDENAEVAEKACTYSYDNSTTMVQWTAYKFTERAPVQATFDTVEVNGTQSSEDMGKVLENATFTLHTASTQTGDMGKNNNIVTHFFGSWIDPGKITGTVRSIDLEKGEALFSLKMNGLELDVDGELTVEENKIRCKGEVDLLSWNGQKAIDNLNEACKANHTGPDGKLMVWPIVTFYLETTLTKNCE